MKASPIRAEVLRLWRLGLTKAAISRAVALSNQRVCQIIKDGRQWVEPEQRRGKR